MGVRIVLDGPRPRRAGRAAAVAASVPLILVGVVGLIGLVYLVALQLTDSFRGSDKTTAALYTAWCAVAAFAGLWLGLQLLRGRRRLVLFLRRFGYADATKALSFAATNAIGGSWRLVTLDDDMVQGIGGSTAPRKASGAGTLFVLAAVGVFVWWFMQFGADMFLDDWMSSATGTSTGSDGLDGIGKALGGAMVLGLVVFILMWLLIALVGVSVPLLLFSYFKARRAERALTQRIRTEREIPGRVSKLARKSSKILSPRLTVVTVAHAVWRQAVVGFAHASGVVIIDVTIPSDALRWEIQTLLPTLGNRCVLVGRLDALTRTLPNGRTVMNDSPLAHDIDGHEILAYRPDPQGLRRFAKALRGTIESRA